MTLSCLYRGSLQNGHVFDDTSRRGNQPLMFCLGAHQVIQGWDEGLVGMRVGGRRQLVIPPQLGYGTRGVGSIIPPPTPPSSSRSTWCSSNSPPVKQDGSPALRKLRLPMKGGKNNA
ncbi:MAG: FKBP-type peptidyl-prolyl cis-trans isomerase, partial [Candidatus Xenobia bacterium]